MISVWDCEYTNVSRVLDNVKYKYVLFDLDGTLLDTSEGIAVSINETAKMVGLPQIPQEDMRRFIGPPLEVGMQNYFDITTEKLQAVVAVFRDVYKANNMLKAKPYKGALELLQQLAESGVKVAIATYKRHEYAMKIIKHFGLNRFCSCCYGSDSEKLATKDDILKKCLEDMAADADKSVYIGDTIFDAESAANTNIDFVGVTYGFGFVHGEENPTRGFPRVGMASDISGLANILAGGNSQ